MKMKKKKGERKMKTEFTEWFERKNQLPRALLPMSV